MPDLSKRIVVPVNPFDKVSVKRGIVYSADGAGLQMDIYAPRAASQRLPAVMFVHGGPVPPEVPQPSSWGIYQSYGELVAAAGLLAVVFNHQLHGLEHYERSQAQVLTAVEFVRRHAGELGVDENRLALWAFSGGGPLVSWALRERPSYLRCALMFYTLVDLAALLPGDAPDSLRERARALSPIHHLKRSQDGLPLLIARAGLDVEMVNAGLDGFISACIEHNWPVDILNHARGVHGFDALTDDQRSRDIITTAIDFIGRHLRNQLTP